MPASCRRGTGWLIAGGRRRLLATAGSAIGSEWRTVPSGQRSGRHRPNAQWTTMAPCPGDGRRLLRRAIRAWGWPGPASRGRRDAKAGAGTQDDHGTLEDVLQAEVRAELSVFRECFPGPVRRVGLRQAGMSKGPRKHRHRPACPSLWTGSSSRVQPELALAGGTVRAETPVRQFLHQTPEQSHTNPGSTRA